MKKSKIKYFYTSLQFARIPVFFGFSKLDALSEIYKTEKNFVFITWQRYQLLRDVGI